MNVPLDELLYALSRSLDFVEAELLGVTTNHGKRTAFIAVQVCKAMGMSEKDVFDMAGCAMLHDSALTNYMLSEGYNGLGKLENFKVHCTGGEEIAGDFPFLGDTAGIVLHHHENWDGSGFNGLSGNSIPVRAAVLRLADNMDLTLHMGDGRPGLGAEIKEHVTALNGTVYAPQVVEALLSILTDSFIEQLQDKNITVALRESIKSVEVNLSTKQMLNICNMFAGIIDAKSPFTRTHSKGVAALIAIMCDVYNIGGEYKDELVIAGYMHDIGKLSTPREILEKTGPLSTKEMELMRNHVSVTGELLSEVRGLEKVVNWSVSHHEQLNGSGYPKGLVGSSIGFESRLIACCDIYQALTEDRPYRAGMAHEKAQAILNEMAAGGGLDYEVVDVLCSAVA
ncbi:HD domain-containing protein [Desulfovibrio sp. OttesenSCG-928-F07]|nr:HD domain-containing protein [Desulfovibrio sp. OttesenSCG-928-F07]